MNFNLFKSKFMQVGILILIVLVVTVAAREMTIERNKIPVALTYKVRNLSAHEEEWKIATTAQPGDVIEHFLLVHLPSSFTEDLYNVEIKANNTDQNKYRENTLYSVAQGIGEDSPSSISGAFFSKLGLTIPSIKSGEFVDLKWQTILKNDIAFSGSAAPLLENSVAVSAKPFSQSSARAALSLFSTIERSKIAAEKPEKYYMPKVLGMTPREVYEEMGIGALIAGEDLGGISNIAIKGVNKKPIWRMISNNLIEASIPAGLDAGSYNLELYDKNNTVSGALAFQVLPSRQKTIILNSTPSILKSGERRIIVLQGINLSANMDVYLRKRGARKIALENTNFINSRVAAMDVPETISQGEWDVYIDDNKQDIHLNVQ